MHGENEFGFKRQRIESNLQDCPEEKPPLNVEANGVETQMADLIKTLEDHNNNIGLTEGDVYTQLSSTEHELALAKEIGKALLAENIELREKYESLLDEHSNRVEVRTTLYYTACKGSVNVDHCVRIAKVP